MGDDVATVASSSNGPYPVVVGWDVLPSLGHWLTRLGLTRAAWVITDEQVGKHYAPGVLASLRATGVEADVLALPPGEPTKSFESLGRLYAWLAGHRAERGDAIVALGGGVVGDLTGTVAATYLRGMPLVQLPTSLLAMVDSSIGGKVAINLPEGKNLVGSFAPPRLVLADVATLATLPKRALTEGWAEVIKHGFILDADYLTTLEAQADPLLALDREATVAAIARSAQIKGDVVGRDEHETSGLRSLLNYGHTLGHALEAVTGYETLLHGEAVAIGMAAAARISERMGLLSATDVAHHDAVLTRFGLSIRCPPVPMQALWNAMRLDKKVQSGNLRWVLLERLGQAALRNDVPAEMVEAVVTELMGGE
jgi:3-dehydroquinate synthase